jgi:hypothetical protein
VCAVACVVTFISNIAIYETVVRLDGRVKHFVINLIAKEFTDTAVSEVKRELSSIRDALNETY